MKKVVLLLIMLVLVLNASAQLQRQFWGQELGKATKSEVLSSLESKGAFLTNISGSEVVFIKNVRFGGFSWGMAVFYFCDNILCRVMFSDFSDSYVNEEQCEIKWKELTKKFSIKYSEYSKRNEIDCKSFGDDKTVVMIICKNNTVCLGYSDFELENKRMDNEDDEL